VSDQYTLSLKLKAEGVRQTQKDIEDVYKASSKMEDIFRRAEQTNKNFTSSLNGTNSSLKNTKTGVDQATSSFNNLDKKLTASSGRLKVIGRDINRYITLPLLAFSAASIKMATDLNAGLGNVQALLIGTGDRIYELKEDVKALSAETGRSFQDINDALYRTISVFQDTEETTERLNTAIRMGIAGYATAADSVQLLSSVTRAFGDTSAAAVERVADLAFETVRLGDTTIPALSGAMQVATDRADRLNISQEELFATFATLTGITGDASMVATQFRSAMDSLLNPTEELSELFTRLGYANAEAALQGLGMVGVMTAITKEAERSGRPLQDYITRKEGMTLVSRLAGEQLGDFVTKLDQVTSRTGAADQAYEQVTEGVAKFNFQLQQNRQRLQNSFSEIGDNLLPVLVALTDALATTVEIFVNLPDFVQNSVFVLLALVSVLGSVAMLMGVIESLKLAGVFAGMTKAVATLTGGMVSLNLALGVTAGVVAGLVAVFGLVAYAKLSSEREHQKAIESTNRMLEQQRGILQDVVSLQDRNRIRAQAVSAQYVSQFEQSGRIPEIMGQASSFSGTGGETISTQSLSQRMSNVGGRPTPMTTQVNASSTTEQLNSYLQRYQAMLDRFVQDRQKIDDEISKLQPQVEATTLRLTRLLSGGSSADYMQTLNRMSRRFADGADFSEIGLEKQLEVIDQAREINRRFTEEPFVVNLYQTIADSLAQEAKLTDLKSAFAQVGGPEMEGQLNGVITYIEDLLAANVGPVKKTWQEWFSEITGVSLSLIRGQGGEDVARVYSQEMQKIFDFEVALSNALGITPDMTSMIETRIKDLISHVQELFEANTSEDGIDSPFTLMDKLFTSDPGMFNEYKTQISELATSMGTDLTNSWTAQEDAAIRMTEAMRDAGFEVEDYTVSNDELESRMQDIIKIMQALKIRGLDEASSGFQFLQAMLEATASQMQAVEIATERVLNILPDFATVSDGMFGSIEDTFRSGLGQSMFDAFIGDFDSGAIASKFTGLKTEIDALLSQQADESFDWTTELQERLDNLLISYGEMTAQAALFAEIGIQTLATVTESVASGIWDLGSAMASGASATDTMLTSLANLAIELLRIIPMMLIQTGLQLMLNPATLPVGLGLVALGIAGLFAGGAIEGTLNGSSTTETMASGGIISSPTRMGNVLAGEAGKEAVMPLAYTNDGNLGVHIAGGGTAPVVNIEIRNYAGVQVEEEQQPDGSIAIVLRKAVKGMIADGSVDKEMNTRYGVSSRGRS